MNEREKCYSELVGGAIRDLRQNLHKSVRLFAYENDIPQATLSRVERGDGEARLITLKKIAEGFGWSMSELFSHIEKIIPGDFKIFEEEHY